MIYSTNRIASIGEVEVDVNESYFGAGSFYFEQECAQDELALFEMAIKSDIDEALIGESVEELEALNESFAEGAVNKIKEMMRKFREWLASITKSIIAKLTNIIDRDNAKFVKHAKVQLNKVKGGKNYKFSGKIVNFNAFDKGERANMLKDIEGVYNGCVSKGHNQREEGKRIFDDYRSKIEKLMEEDLTVEISDGNMTVVEKHLDFLNDYSKKEIKKIREEVKKADNAAKKIVKDAEKAKNGNKDENANVKERLSYLAELANSYKLLVQTVVKYLLSSLKSGIKTARSVVTRAMGTHAVKEGVEYSPELLEAMIEAEEYALDEALEEPSETEVVEVEDEE